MYRTLKATEMKGMRQYQCELVGLLAGTFSGSLSVESHPKAAVASCSRTSGQHGGDRVGGQC